MILGVVVGDDVTVAVGVLVGENVGDDVTCTISSCGWISLLSSVMPMTRKAATPPTAISKITPKKIYRFKTCSPYTSQKVVLSIQVCYAFACSIF